MKSKSQKYKHKSDMLKKYEDERDEETTKKNKKTTIYKDREKENGFG
jgi:hypothetical protein